MINEAMKSHWGMALEMKMKNLREHLAGHTIVGIEWDSYTWCLHLDDGTQLTIWDRGCALGKNHEELVQVEFEE